MIKTLDRYIIRTFLHSLLMWFIVVLVLRIVVDMFTNMDEFTEGDPTVMELIKNVLIYYSTQMLVYIAEMGGIIIVASAAFTIARMQHTNELTAMLASGVSLYRVVWPIICAAMIMGAIIVVDREVAMPSVRQYLVLKPDEIATMDNSRFSLSFIVDNDGTCWNGQAYDSAKNTIEYPLVIMRDGQTYQYVAHASGRLAEPGMVNGQRGWFVTDGSLMKMDIRTAHGGEAMKMWRQSQGSNAVYTTIGPEVLVKIAKRLFEQKNKIPFPANRAFTAVSYIHDFDRHYNMELRAPRLELKNDSEGNIIAGRLESPQFEFYAEKKRLIAIITAKNAIWIPGSAVQSRWQLNGGRIFICSDLTPDEVELKQSERWLNYLTSNEMTRMLQLKRATDPSSIRMMKFNRVVEPFNSLVMLLLGLPFILSRQRNIKASALRCVLVVGLFYVSFNSVNTCCPTRGRRSCP